MRRTTSSRGLGVYCKRPMRWVVIVGAAVALAASLSVVAARGSSKGLSPQSLYRALLTRQYTGLPSDHYSAKVGADSLNDKDKRHHAVGDVLVTIDSGDAVVDYVIYPTAADVAERWKEPPSSQPGVKKFQVIGPVPGYGNTRSRWINATIEGENAFGKKVTNGTTVMYVQRRNVIVAAATFSTDTESSGDIPGTIKLVKSAIKHLDRVAGWTQAPTKTRSSRSGTPKSLKPRDARASAFVGGNASPRLPVGRPGVVVIAHGPYQQELSLPVVVRNNTSRQVLRISVSGTATTPGGKLLATGKDQTLYPNAVKPGEIAFGYVYFGGDRLPPNARYEFKVATATPQEAQYENRRDLVVVESHRVQSRVLGSLRNPYGKKVTGPIQAMVACFNAAGSLLYTASDFTSQESVNSHGALPFEVDAAPPYGTSGLSCPNYLVAASGFSN
jgi:hypothetical protein